MAIPNRINTIAVQLHRRCMGISKLKSSSHVNKNEGLEATLLVAFCPANPLELRYDPT
jgi:hypothetical protein